MSAEQVTTEEMLRRYEILLERTEDNHKLLAEGYTLLCDRIDRLDQKVDHRFGELSYRVDALAVSG